MQDKQAVQEPLNILGLFWSPWDRRELDDSGDATLTGRYWRHMRQSSDPRSEAWMSRAFEVRYPMGRFRVIDPATVSSDEFALMGDTVIVLLYPDAIGLGFGPLERRLRASLPMGATVHVLNGRRRSFALDGATCRALMLRRAIKRLLLGEMVFSLVFVAMTPILLVADWMRGRR